MEIYEQSLIYCIADIVSVFCLGIVLSLNNNKAF